jgi:hypothetical protein
MKKISVISVIIAIISVAVLAFAFSDSPGNSNINPSPASTTVNIHIKGCTDCTYIGYCLDGGKFVHVGSCDFSINCEELGLHKICIWGTNCPAAYNLGVFKKFECTGFGTVDIDMTCSEPCDCTCEPAVKKKK